MISPPKRPWKRASWFVSIDVTLLVAPVAIADSTVGRRGRKVGAPRAVFHDRASASLARRAARPRELTGTLPGAADRGAILRDAHDPPVTLTTPDSVMNQRLNYAAASPEAYKAMLGLE